jgi:hypothetical protein
MSWQTEQAKMAYRYYIQGDRTIAWDPQSGTWVPVAQTSRGDSTPPPGAPGYLSSRALQRIGPIQDALARGLISHDAADAEILQILREET